MTTFDDWGAEYAEDFEYDLDVARVRREQAGVVGEALRLVSPGIARGGSAPNITQRIQNKILSGVPLSRTDIDQIVPSSKEEATLSARVEIDPKLKSFWAITRAERDALQKSEEIGKALEKQRGQRNLYNLLDPGSERAVEAKRKLDSATEQIVKLRDDQSGIRTESQSAFEAFRKDTGIPEMGTVEDFVDPRIADRVKAARAAELGRDRDQQRPAEPMDLGDYLGNLYAGTTAATAAPAAPAITGTTGTTGATTGATPAITGTGAIDPYRNKWLGEGLSPERYDELVSRMGVEGTNRSLEGSAKTAKRMNMPLAQFLGFSAQGVGDPGAMAPLTITPSPAPGTGEDRSLTKMKADAAAALDAQTQMPGARELAFGMQSDPTVWSRLGLQGVLARDPYTDQPISTAQLSGLGREGLEDWYYRTVQPRYAFRTAEAAAQRRAGVTPEFQPGFEAFAQKAPGLGRITPEEALRGQQAVIAALQAPRDVLDPYSQELFAYFDETGGLDAPQNERLLAALAAPTLSQISARYRRPATERIQQELRNRMVMEPEQQMLSFFTGKPAARPEYEPGTFEALAGGMPPARQVTPGLF